MGRTAFEDSEGEMYSISIVVIVRDLFIEAVNLPK
jgi:hypothetical protein